MLENTNLEKVKKLALIYTNYEVKEIGLYPFVNHPYVNCAIISKYSRTGERLNSLESTNILEDKESCCGYFENIRSRIKNARSVIEISYMITKNYLLTFLKCVKEELSREDLSDYLTLNWQDIGYSCGDINVSKFQLLKMFEECDPKILMNEIEYEKFKNLPEKVVIYRGVTEYNKKNLKSLSWTLDKEQAIWFATKDKTSGYLYRAEIKKEHIIAYFEYTQEIIADYRYLKEIKLVENLEANRLNEFNFSF